MAFEIFQRRPCAPLHCSIEIDASPMRVFERWVDYERLPRVLRSVRRVQRVDRRLDQLRLV